MEPLQLQLHCLRPPPAFQCFPNNATDMFPDRPEKLGQASESTWSDIATAAATIPRLSPRNEPRNGVEDANPANLRRPRWSFGQEHNKSLSGEFRRTPGRQGRA
uniref:Uncharacterized protein n=1 Tax=Arundo donax TaxID=35708 RepID=A0A0A9G3F7_ARUDO